MVGAPLADSLVRRDSEMELVRSVVRDVRAGQAAVLLLIEREAGSRAAPVLGPALQAARW